MKHSLLGFGAMRLPENVAECKKMFSTYLDSGGNFIDTAYVYAGSEEMIKKALTSQHPRDSYLLTNKLPVWSVGNIKDCDRIFEESLKRCGVDYFDYYLLHSLGKDNEQKAVSIGMYEWAAEQKKKGLVRHVGFSFHDEVSVLEEILAAHPEMEFVFLQLNYVDVLRGPFAAQHEAALRYNKPIIAMEPVKGGTLATLPNSAEALLKAARPNDSIASWAIRYAAGLKGVEIVLSGMSSLAQVEDNIRILNPYEPMDEKDYALLEQVMEALSKEGSIPCTGCKYCIADCPQNIEIANSIMIYNEYMRAGHKFNRQLAYNNLPDGQRANDCTSCGICLSLCPQKIDIPSALETVSKEFAS